jgi:hypothetical protein
MKIQQPDVSAFKPVVLTLENQAEVNMLYAFFAASSTSTDDVYGAPDNFSWDAYKALQQFADVGVQSMSISTGRGPLPYPEA